MLSDTPVIRCTKTSPLGSGDALGYPPNHPLFAQAVQILTDHNTMAATMGSNRNNRARDALRSTFALACESPRALGIGL